MNPDLAAIRVSFDKFKADFYGPNGPQRAGAPEAIAQYDEAIEAISELGTSLDALEAIQQRMAPPQA